MTESKRRHRDHTERDDRPLRRRLEVPQHPGGEQQPGDPDERHEDLEDEEVLGRRHERGRHECEQRSRRVLQVVVVVRDLPVEDEAGIALVLADVAPRTTRQQSALARKARDEEDGDRDADDPPVRRARHDEARSGRPRLEVRRSKPGRRGTRSRCAGSVDRPHERRGE